MSDGTKIEWTDATWNVVNGCSVLSPGCTNCYAMRLAGTRMRQHPSRQGLTVPSKAGPVWNGTVRFNDKVLLDPLKWKRPRKIFVCAHGDLFHENVPDDWIDKVFAVMALCPQHVFQVLTKRPERMREYLTGGDRAGNVPAARIGGHTTNFTRNGGWKPIRLPLPNVWLGVSVEDQARADERIPLLLATPAKARWLSCEPLLGPVKLPRVNFHCDLCGGTGMLARWPKGRCHHCNGRGDIPAISTDPKFGTPATPMRRIDWVVAGGESGPGARPMHPDWARSLRDQCAAANVPFLFKQWGEFAPIVTAGHNDPRYPADPPTGERMERFGKKAAGRLLDGVQHDGYPASGLGQSTTLAEMQ
jgi:protein gp37